MILFEVQRYYNNQTYLETLYKALFALAYYGMFRVCELTKTDSGHAVRAVDVSLAKNKKKLLFLLRTSKTHGLNKRPQQIKIAANDFNKIYFRNRCFCPFQLTLDYMLHRGPVLHESEQFFVFKDKTPVCDHNVRTVMKAVIDRLGLDSSLYGMHSYRIGRTSDLINKFHMDIEFVKRIGQWKSSEVYKYIRN